MSSHHIVRDEQEPALLILSLRDIRNSTIDELLEWSPTVVLPDILINDVLNRGFRFDIILCEEAKENLLRKSLRAYFPLRFLSASPDLWLDRTIDCLVESGHNALSIITDQFDDRFMTKKHLPNIDLVIYDTNFKWHRVQTHFKKWFPKGKEIRMVGSNFEITGYITSNRDLGDSYITEYNGMIVVSCSEPIWFGERII
ncbi:MAG: hypothetical protein AAGA64_01760 [Bacteroidota bacterium]